MKSTGMVRKVDRVGRVVIPVILRQSLDLNGAEPLEFFLDNNKIILKKYEGDRTCAITGTVSKDNLSLLEGSLILSP